MNQPIDNLASVLAALLSSGSIEISKIGKRARKVLLPLEMAGQLERKRSGVGQRMHVVRRDALDRFVSKLYPSGLYATDLSDHSDRLRGLQAVRDSKRFRKVSAAVLTLWAREGVRILNPMGDVLDLGDWSSKAGCCSLVLDVKNVANLCFDKNITIMTVENKSNFLSIGKFIPSVDLAIHTGGRLPRLAVSWLKNLAAAGARIIHFGDYDPVGLCEFLRLTNACKNNVSLFVPDNVSTLFSDFSNRKLMMRKGSTRLMEKLRMSNNPQIRKIIELIDEHNGGLEQEALLVSQKSRVISQTKTL